MKKSFIFFCFLIIISNALELSGQCNLKKINENLEKQINKKNFVGGLELIENFEKKCKTKKSAEYYDFLFYKSNLLEEFHEDSLAIIFLREAFDYFVQDKSKNKNYPNSVILFSNLLIKKNDLSYAENILLESEKFHILSGQTDSTSYLNTLNNLASIYYFKSDYETALQRFLNLNNLIISSERQNSKISIETNQNIAAVYGNMAKFDLAKKHAEIALNVCTQNFPKEINTIANLWNTLGWIESQNGKLDDAKKIYLSGLEVLKSSEIIDSSLMGAFYQNLANISIKQNILDEAEKYSEANLSIVQGLFSKHHPKYAEALNMIGMIYLKKSEIEKARHFIQNAIKIVESSTPNTDKHATYLINLATLEMFNSEYFKAIYNFNKGLNILENKKNFGAIYGLCKNNLAVLNLQINNPKKAEQLLLENKELYNKIYSANHVEKGRLLGNLGFTQLKMNMVDSALSNMKKVIQIINLSNQIDNSIASTYNNIGLAYTAKNKLDSAKYYFKLSISEYSKIQEKGSTIFDSYNVLYNLGEIYKKENNIDSALYYKQMAMDSSFAKYGNLNLVYFKSTVGLIELYAKKNDFDACKLVILRANDSFKETLQNFATYNSEKEVIKFIEILEEYKNALTSVAIQYGTDFNGLIYNIELQLKNKILETIIERNKLIKTKPIEAQEEYETWKALKLTYINKVNKNVLTQEDGEKLLSQISSLERSINSKFEKSEFFKDNITWESLAKMLQSNQKNVEIIKYKNKLDGKVSTHYAAAIIGRDFKGPKIVYLCSELAIDSLFICEAVGDDLIKINQAYGNGKKNEPGKLYSLIWNKIEKYLIPNDEVIIAPAGKLANINFNAIKTKNGKYVSDKYNVKLKWSTRTDQNTEKTYKQPTKGILVGGINYNVSKDIENTTDNDSRDLIASAPSRSGTHKWMPLDGSKSEIDTIAHICLLENIDALRLSDSLANENNFRSLLEESCGQGFIHISTHGYFIEKNSAGENGLTEKYVTFYDNPYNRCGLVMSGANDNKIEVPLGDGIMSGSEIAEMNLDGTELVVLSACESGLGTSTSEGPIGLQRAFKLAGAKNIISTLWKIPDQSSSELMTSFYHYYLHEKLKPAEALKKAQHYLSIKYPNPFYWAGFVLLE